MKVTKQDYIIFIGAVILFIYFFFIVPPEPVYFDDDGFNILPSDARYDEETGKWIIGYERSSIIVIAPLIAMLWLLLIAFGPDRPPLREIPMWQIIKQEIREKAYEGKMLTKEYFHRKK